MTSSPPVFEVAAFTHRGAVRGHNEDTVYVAGQVLTGDLDKPYWARLSGGLIMVADGMGGHAYGELASRTAVDALGAQASRLGQEAGCHQALKSVNAQIFELMERRAEAVGMGTTVVGVVVEADGVVHFNIGDSRAYRHGAGGLGQLSCDDVPGGRSAGRHRASHALTQCLGGFATPLAVDPHVGTEPALQAGEALLLCSDGLTDMVDLEDIAQIVETLLDPAEAIEALVGRAMAAGGHDNISIVIVRAAANESGSSPGGARDRA